jgi:hypothetical protein
MREAGAALWARTGRLCAITPHQVIISSSQNVRMLTIVRAETARTNSKLLRDLALGQGILSSEARALQSII